jgi:hypothetical protein
LKLPVSLNQFELRVAIRQTRKAVLLGKMDVFSLIGRLEQAVEGDESDFSIDDIL